MAAYNAETAVIGIRAEDSVGITSEYLYDGTQDGSATFGVVTEIVTTTDELIVSESMTYTQDYNYLESYTDARGMTSYYDYDVLSGRLLSATDPNGNTVDYSYENIEIDGMMIEQQTVTGQAEPNGPPVMSNYYSMLGNLQVIMRGDDLDGYLEDDCGDFYYQMGRDELGRITGAAVKDN